MNWKTITTDPLVEKSLWNPHHVNFIRCFKFNVSNDSIDCRIKNLCLDLIKKKLEKANVDISRCLGRPDDLRKFLKAMLLFDKELAHLSILNMSHRTHGMATRSTVKTHPIYYPEWALSIGEWKSTYFYSIKGFFF